ncbi:hypothetical protein [Nostoc sp.]|uniref:hypothetical protein n=1 Tax=Nostoc sp. TaxID=1180 RepID=UPI002FF6B6C7
MPKIKTANDPLRSHYEAIANQVLRHSQWSEIRSNLIRSGMRLSKQNVAKYAKFRQLAPRKHITLLQREAYQEFINQYGSRPDFLGVELIEIVQQLYPPIKNRPTQIRKRFYAVGLKCDRSSIYSFQDACKAVASCLLYTPKEWK